MKNHYSDMFIGIKVDKSQATELRGQLYLPHTPYIDMPRQETTNYNRAGTGWVQKLKDIARIVSE